MIAKIYGTCDNAYIQFKEYSPNVWYAQVPANKTGEYYVQIFTEDEFGNTGYIATALFAIDISKLHTSITLTDIAADADMTLIQALLGISDTCEDAEATMTDIQVVTKMTDVRVDVTAFEIVGR